MNHIEIKNTLAGAGGGGGGSPKPPLLKPPEIGEYSIAASYSYSEIVDLISDGPIEGLTDEKGAVLDSSNYLMGVYLNDIPVEVSSNTSSNQTNQGDFGGVSFPMSEMDNLMTYSMDRIEAISPNFYNKRFLLHTYDLDTRRYTFRLQGGAGPDPTIGSIVTNAQDGTSFIHPQDYMTANIIDSRSAGVEGFESGRAIMSYQGYRTISDTQYTTLSAGNRAIGDPGPNLQNYGAGIFYAEKNNFWIEMALHMYPYPRMINPGARGYRQKIDEGINKLVDITTSENYTEYTKRYLYNLLNVQGIITPLGDPLERTRIVDEIYDKFQFNEKLNSYQRWNQNYPDMISPFVFLSPIEGTTIDGYNEVEHSNIFKNEDVNVYNLESGDFNDTVGRYRVNDFFVYEDNYYRVTSASLINTDAEGGYFKVFTNSNESVNKQLQDALSTSENPEGNISLLADPPNDINMDIVFNLSSDSEVQRGFGIGTSFRFLVPNIDENRLWDGTVFGFEIHKISHTVVKNFSQRYFDYGGGDDSWEEYIQMESLIINMDAADFDFYRKITGYELVASQFSDPVTSSRKYNYSNILMEFRNGEQYQDPLNYFRWVYIDHFYNSTLLGPFNTQSLFTAPTSAGVQRLWESSSSGLSLVQKKADGVTPKLNFASNSIPIMDRSFLVAIEEKSADRRTPAGDSTKDYANWNKSKEEFNEKAQPITHIIENPNVQSCFITVSLRILADSSEGDRGAIDAGKRLPAPLNIRVEVGLVNENGEEEPYYDRFFQIVALVENPNYMDIGNPENLDSRDDYGDIREVEPNSETYDTGATAGGIFEPFELPEIKRSDIRGFNTNLKEDLKTKRYIKVSKLSTETNSTLLRRDVSLVKVTEIIENTLIYPYSSIVATKIDSRVFSDIPKRTYKAKLKKVRVPSNYFPTIESGLDKRYYKKKSEFDIQTKINKEIYKGDWDGSFKFAWTDNPAWILYDMLTATRYGLGDQISDDQVNKWDLYKIGRFCDAVDENGFFQGVPDGRGGIEPRFSCNIIFTEGTKIYDAITSIAAIFRGIVYFNNETISFSDDRIKEPIALFTNSNVSDGIFSYSSYKRDEKFNAVEVNYKDRNDGFKTKVEYVENEQDILDRGLFKKEIIAAGITSKAMARRAAKHVMYQTTRENETVIFKAGTEALLCKPGDLIIIEDDLRTLRSNYGRILDIDDENKTIRTSEQFRVNNYEKTITVYIPTGNETKKELDERAESNRSRLTGFYINGTTLYSEFDNNFSGQYGFAGYINRDPSLNTNLELDDYYAYYTGENESEPVIWFNTNVTGWVFSTGLAFTDNEENNLFILNSDLFNFSTISYPTQPFNLEDHSGVDYDTIIESRRGTPRFSFVNQFRRVDSFYDLKYTAGIEDSEVVINGNPQIRKFNITGWNETTSGFGDLVYIDQNDINANLLRYIPAGSTYRFQAKDSTDQVYKITSIREEDNHSYAVTAAKYDSGKFEEIENDINIQEEPNTFGYTDQSFFINDIEYKTLDTPVVDLQENTNQISVSWEEIEYATGYKIKVQFPDYSYTETNKTNPFYQITTPYIGDYKVSVQALANTFDNANYNLRLKNSEFSSNSIFIFNGDEIQNDGPMTVFINYE